MLSAISSSHIALYQVSVRWARCLPLTSFRFHLAMDTLVSLAGRFPLPGLVRDLHPLDDTHAGQTESGRSKFNTLFRPLFFGDVIVGLSSHTLHLFVTEHLLVQFLLHSVKGNDGLETAVTNYNHLE